MKTDELKKKALEHIHETVCFSCALRAYGGGACGDGWDGDGELYLNRAQLLYLIFKKNEVNGEKTQKVDVYALIRSMAYDGAWPDGEPDDEDISHYSYSGDSEELDIYLESWEILLKKIENSEINESNIDEWLPYFDDRSNWEYNINTWKD